jgi:hypothetical protein
MEEQPIVNTSIEMGRESIKNVTISQEDKERFFKSIMSDTPYEETISLFDNQFKIKLRSMTVEENSDVVNQIVADRKNEIAQDNDAYFITISTYRLALSLLSVNGIDFSSITKENFSPTTEKETYILARAAVMTRWTTTKLSVFLDAFQAFEAKVLKLSSEVQSPNFWKASV